MAARWFPFLAALFFWIWFSNMIGFLPLPTNTEHTVNVFGARNPLLRDLRGDRQPLDPAGPDPGRLDLLPRRRDPGQGLLQVPGELAAAGPRGHEPDRPRRFIFVIEAISHFARLISLSVRLFANILAGHLLLLFMGGGLAVLLGIAALGALTFPLAFFFFIFEVGPDRHPAGIHLLDPHRHLPRRSHLRQSLEKEHFFNGSVPCRSPPSPTKASKPPARRSPSASVPGSARSAPASASASSSVRRSSRSPASPR